MSTLNVGTRKIDEVVVVDLKGRLTCGEPQLLLRDTLERYVTDGSKRFVLNLGNVDFVDSSGLSELVSAWTRLDGLGGKINLLGLKKKVRDILVITKLAVVFDLFEEEARAVAALQ